MTQIHFYILSDENHLLFTCRLLEKNYKQKRRMYIHTDNQKKAHDIDELLWTYRDDSFLPHHLYNEGPDNPPPIQIGFNYTPEKHRDILINLSETVPEFYSQFACVFEVVPSDAVLQQAARVRYRHYQTQKNEIVTHKE